MRSGKTCTNDMTTSSAVSADEIEQREKEDPDDVDEVPIEADAFDIVVVVRAEPPLVTLSDEPDEQPHADDHVHGVKARHAEIEQEEQLGVSLDVRWRRRRERHVRSTLAGDARWQVRSDGVAAMSG